VRGVAQKPERPGDDDDGNDDRRQRVGPLEFLNEWLAYGGGIALTAFDGLDHHPYAWQWGPTYVADWNSFQQMHGLWDALVDAGRDDALIWMSEIGSVTRPDASQTDPASPFSVGGYASGPVPSGGWVTDPVAINYTLGAQRVVDYAVALRDAGFYDPGVLKHVLGPSCWFNLNDSVGGIGTTWAAGTWAGHYGAYEYGTDGYDGPAKGGIVAAWQATFSPDIMPPIGSVALPVPGDTITGICTVSVVATDDRDDIVETVEILVDGLPVARAVPFSGVYIGTFDSTTSPNGTRLISARLTDVAGNIGETPSVGVTFYNVDAPVLNAQPNPPVAIVTEYPPYTTDDLIDLVPGVGRVAMSTIFEVRDRAGSYLGTLQPTQGGSQLRHSTDRAITRTLSGVEFDARDLAEINTLTDRLYPYTVYETGDRRALGVFSFADASRNLTPAWEMRTTQFYDLGIVIDTDLERPLTIRAGENLLTAFEAIAAEVGIERLRQEGRALAAAQPLSWPAGTSRYEILKVIAATLGCYAPYFDAVGTLVCAQVPDLITATPNGVYNYGGRILKDTLVVTDETYKAPNRYIVTGGGQTAVSAYFDVPADAPHSIQNRGYVVAETISLSGISTEAAAYAAAIAAYARDVRSWTVCEFDSTPDPRHGTYDVLEVLGEPYIETEWSLDLSPGGVMKHKCSRVWTG
jgi:hypothetical protein